MVEYYPQLRHAHITLAVLSVSLFAVRGALALAGSTYAQIAPVRYTSYTIDTLLLTAALMLTSIIHQYPFVNGWLTMKVVLLVVYVVLGAIALKRGRTPRTRAIAYVAALATVGFLFTVAVAHHPLGVFAPFLVAS